MSKISIGRSSMWLLESFSNVIGNRHNLALRDAQAQISKVNKMLDVLTCDLGLAKSDTAQLERWLANRCGDRWQMPENRLQRP